MSIDLDQRQFEKRLRITDRPAEQRGERSAYPARIGAGWIVARDQGVSGQCAALIGSERLALPFRRLALGVSKWPGPSVSCGGCD